MLNLSVTNLDPQLQRSITGIGGFRKHFLPDIFWAFSNIFAYVSYLRNRTSHTTKADCVDREIPLRCLVSDLDVTK